MATAVILVTGMTAASVVSFMGAWSLRPRWDQYRDGAGEDRDG